MVAQRISGLSNADAPFWARAYYALQRRLRGTVLEPTRVWSRAPAAMLGFLHFGGAVNRRHSPLDPALRSLITVKVSQLNHCEFCIDLNAATLLERGVPLEKALALGDYAASPLFSRRERAALDYASAMVQGPGVDDVVFDRLREFFDENAIVELTALVALQDASSRFNAALRIPAQGFCPVVLGASTQSKDAG